MGRTRRACPCVNGPQVASGDYEAVRNQIIAAFENLTDPANPGEQVVLRVLKKEDLSSVQGVDSLHPSRSGDVVVILRPPYQFDAATLNQRIAFSQFFGQHGYLPDLVDIPHDVNMHSTFIAAGPGIRQQAPIAGVRQIDLAPTLAFLMGVPGPANARGEIMLNIAKQPGRFKEATVLYISDFHGQLTPLSQTADTVAGTGSANPSFSIGGAAFLKPWFDWYRGEASSGSILVTGGDAVGASPPISNFFGDKPTMTVFNMLGVSADTLGNHNFDRGSAYLRNELIPLANFPYLSANVTFANGGGYPAEWKPSQVFKFGGMKLGVIGYELPTRRRRDLPGLPRPVRRGRRASGDQRRGRKAQEQEGRRRGPRGRPHRCRRHGRVQPDRRSHRPRRRRAERGRPARRPHAHPVPDPAGQDGDLLVAESAHAGTRFTRIRIIVDTTAKKVVYTTADFHKPWDLSVKADPAIQAFIDDLNTQLAPIFNTVIAQSTVYVPRADAVRPPGWPAVRVPDRRHRHGRLPSDLRHATSRSPTRAASGPT